MEIKVQELDKCKLEVYYEADAGKIFNKRNEVLNIFKKAPVPGFRKGKSSIDSVKFHYSKQIEEALKRALAEDAFHDTLFEKKLKAHGGPRYKEIVFVDGKFHCTFEVYTKPEFTLSQYKELEIPKPHSDLNESNLTEKMLQELRVKFGEVNSYTEDDYIQDGDNVIINYESFNDGEKIEQLCAEGEMIKVGDTSIPFINENILGMKVNETREFDFVAPENSLPSLAGKLIHFSVTLVMGSKTVLCPLNDDLAKKINMENIEKVREFVASAALGKLSAFNKQKLTEAVSLKLVEMNKDFEVPNWMTLSEAQYLAQQSKLNWEVLQDLDKKKFMSLAENNVRLSLILDEIRQKDPEAQLSETEVLNIIKQNLARTKTEMSVDDAIQNMSKSGQLNVLFARILDEYALDLVVKTAKVIE